MAQYAMLHSATRVIKAVTTDASTPVAPGDVLQLVGGPDLNLGGGPWKLAPDNATLQVPTALEISNAEIDPVVEAAKRDAFMADYKAHLQALRAASTNNQIKAALDELALDWWRLAKKLTETL